jgi:acetylornithine deacetylase/succinyl-diaminopimelate desuccinylase-like protein
MEPGAGFFNHTTAGLPVRVDLARASAYTRAVTAEQDTVRISVEKTREFVDRTFQESIVPTLIDYIRIPNKSPHFDPEWQAHGHMDRAVDLLSDWARAHMAEDMTLEVIREPSRTPLIVIEIPATGRSDDTVLLYGHLDKQPEMTGWDADKGPWIPLLQGDALTGRLYGRGGADDGYAIFSSLTAINALREQGVPHARCILLIEACEESGSVDLPHYIDVLAPRIGTPSLVVCLDAGCGNYDQLWLTTSLRGVVTGNLRVDVLREGVHSGDASGIVPSSFRILRQVLERLEDPHNGTVLPDSLYAAIPHERIVQAARVAEILGTSIYDKFPLMDGMRPVNADLTELVINQTWRPQLATVGANGFPAVQDAGNVRRPYSTVKLSLRLPPTVDAAQAVAELRELLLANPPYGAKVTLEDVDGAGGWDAPPLAEWLERALAHASTTYFGADAMYRGEGGSIPFMGMLGQKFPNAQFMITGVLGPASNAHGPNEFLHLAAARNVTCCVADVLAAHDQRE